MTKALLIQAIIDVLREDFANQQSSSRQIRAAGNDSESKAEGKYDTRSTEENYLADGLARQAHATAQAASAYDNFTAPSFDAKTPIDIGALVELSFPDGREWFFLGPAGGGIEVTHEGQNVTVVTPESPLGAQLIGLKTGDTLAAPKAKILSAQ